MSKVEMIDGMSFADYVNIDAVNASTLLTHWGRTPLEARYEQLHGNDSSSAMTVGSAAHAAILETNTFEDVFVTQPTAGGLGFGDFRTKAAREARDTWLDEHKDSVTLTDSEYATAIGMRDATKKDEFLTSLLTSPGKNELTLVWTDKGTGLKCKARLDRITTYQGWNTLIDVKTARDLDTESCKRAIAKYHYHIRMAWYADALQLLFKGKKEIRVCLMWIKNSPPYLGRVQDLEDDSLAEGRRQYKRLFKLQAEGLKNNKWPGFPDCVEPVELPSWAYGNDE